VLFEPLLVQEGAVGAAQVADGQAVGVALDQAMLPRDSMPLGIQAIQGDQGIIGQRLAACLAAQDYRASRGRVMHMPDGRACSSTTWDGVSSSLTELGWGDRVGGRFRGRVWFPSSGGSTSVQLGQESLSALYCVPQRGQVTIAVSDAIDAPDRLHRIAVSIVAGTAT